MKTLQNELTQKTSDLKDANKQLIIAQTNLDNFIESNETDTIKLDELMLTLTGCTIKKSSLDVELKMINRGLDLTGAKQRSLDARKLRNQAMKERQSENQSFYQAYYNDCFFVKISLHKMVKGKATKVCDFPTTELGNGNGFTTNDENWKNVTIAKHVPDASTDSGFKYTRNVHAEKRNSKGVTSDAIKNGMVYHIPNIAVLLGSKSDVEYRKPKVDKDDVQSNSAKGKQSTKDAQRQKAINKADKAQTDVTIDSASMIALKAKLESKNA